jgi:hypothetical protein
MPSPAMLRAFEGWDSGVVTISEGARELVLDFNKP